MENQEVNSYERSKGMTREEKKKRMEAAYKREEKQFAEEKDAADRLLGFIAQDDGMQGMELNRIKNVFKIASDSISALTGRIPLGKMLQACQEMLIEQQGGQESHPAS